MIYVWCTSCQTRECLNKNSHMADRSVQYRADFMLGGRKGKRIRKLFSTKKDAESFEYITLADYKRGTFLPQAKSKTLFEEFYKEYLDKSVCLYQKGAQTEIYRLGAFTGRLKGLQMSQITGDAWEAYMMQRLKDGIAKSTLNRDLTAIKVMFGWAVEKKYLLANPFEQVKAFEVDNVRVRWLSDEEITTLLVACTNARDLELRDICLFALNTGFRKANLRQVTANDILDQRIQARKTKSGKPYEVPINMALSTLLDRLIRSRPSGPLLNFSNFRRRFDAVVKDPTVTLHTFRHTFASQCLRRGVPIDRVCAWMGHFSIEFTRKHYGHLCKNKEQEEINLLNLGYVSPQSESNRHSLIENQPSLPLDDGGNEQNSSKSEEGF